MPVSGNAGQLLQVMMNLIQNAYDAAATKSVGKGNGLGLSISYGIVEQHAGQLSAENLPQGGAQFTLVLPLIGR